MSGSLILTEQGDGSEGPNQGDYEIVIVDGDAMSWGGTGTSVWGISATKYDLAEALSNQGRMLVVIGYLQMHTLIPVGPIGAPGPQGGVFAWVDAAALLLAQQKLLADPPRWDVWSAGRATSPYRPRPVGRFSWDHDARIAAMRRSAELAELWVETNEKMQAAELAGDATTAGLLRSQLPWVVAQFRIADQRARAGWPAPTRREVAQAIRAAPREIRRTLRGLVL